MSLAIANFEEQVWLGAFLPKWERIVARIISRPKIKAVRKKKDAAAAAAQEAGAAAAVSSPSAPTSRESTSSDGAARVLSDLASGSGSGVWNTSSKGAFTKQGQSLLTRWFVDHITDPYPKDHEKHELARAARLSYDQISAWFINARGRKWVSWIRELQAGTMSQSPSVAAASAVGVKPGAEGAEYKLKRIEAMKGEPKPRAKKRPDAAAAAAGEAGNPKSRSKASGAAKGRKKKVSASVEIESESEEGEEEGASDFSEEEQQQQEDEDASMTAAAIAAAAAAIAGPRRSTRERKAPAVKDEDLESDSDDPADDANMMIKQEELEAQEADEIEQDSDDQTPDDARANASSRAAAAAAASAGATVPAGQMFMTHSPSLSASNPALLLGGGSVPPQFLDPLAQHVFSSSAHAPFNVLTLTHGQHAQLTLPTMGGALSDSALAMSMSGPMPAMDSAAVAGDGATIGAGVAAPSSSAAAAASAAAPAASMQPLRSADAMLMSVDPFTSSIAHVQLLQYQMRTSGLNMSGTITGLPGPAFSPSQSLMMPPPIAMQHSANPHTINAMAMQHSGGGMMLHQQAHATSPTMSLGTGTGMSMGSMGAAGAPPSFLQMSPMQPPHPLQSHQPLHHQPPHSNPSATLLQGRVPAPFVSGVPQAFTAAPASRNQSPAQMSLTDSSSFNDSQMGAQPRSNSTAAVSPLSSSSSSSTPAPTFGAFRFG